MSFRTQTDNIPPIVLEYSPTGVNVSVGTDIKVTFNEQMNTSSYENGIVLIPEVKGTYHWDRNTLSFTPKGELRYSTEYHVTVGLGLKDRAGNAMENLFLFSFTTEPDTYPPHVISHSPFGVEVDIWIDVTVTFSEDMDGQSVESAFSISPHVEGSFSWNGTTLFFSHNEFASNTVYTVTIGSNAKDDDGNSLSEPYQFSFTSKIDPYSPFVVEVDPKGKAVPVDSDITISFNEAMELNSLYRAIVIEPSIAGSTQMEGDSIVVFTPNGLLVKGTTYNVTVTIEAEDLAGNRMQTNYSWEFTTESEEVTSASPFAYDVLFFWIFFVVILIIVIILLYEFVYRRRMVEYIEDEDMELEMPEEDEPQDMDDIMEEEYVRDDLDEGEDGMFAEGEEEGLSDEEPEYGDEPGEEEGYSEEEPGYGDEPGEGEEPLEEEPESKDEEDLDDILKSIDSLEKENSGF